MSNYGNKRDFPKIETWRIDGVAQGRIPLVTSWARTIKEAREQRAKALGIDVSLVRAARVR